jgi:hypothetical protein
MIKLQHAAYSDSQDALAHLFSEYPDSSLSELKLNVDASRRNTENQCGTNAGPTGRNRIPILTGEPD